MGFFESLVDVARVASKVASELLIGDFVPIPPGRVDPPYDSSPLRLGKDYVRLWLAEVQHHAPSADPKGGEYLFYSRTEFQYGNKKIGIPAFFSPSTLGLGTATTPRILNMALTPIFPFRDEVNLMCALMRLESVAELEEAILLLEQLTGMLSTTRFSLHLDLLDILWKGLTRIAGRSKQLSMAVFNAFPNRLSPGYFALIKPSS